MIFSVFVNFYAVDQIKSYKLSSIEQDPILTKATSADAILNICFNHIPIYYGHNCNDTPIKVSSAGLIREPHNCILNLSEPDSDSMNFTTNSSFITILNNYGNITFEGYINTSTNRTPENISIDVNVTDNSSCMHNTLELNIIFTNLEYLYGGVILKQNYPSNETDQLKLKEGFTTYHLSLDEFFEDIDGLDLEYEFYFFDLHCFNIDIDINETTNAVTYYAPVGSNTESTGPCRAKIIATNPNNQSNETNVFSITIEKAEQEENQDEDVEEQNNPNENSNQNDARISVASAPSNCWIEDVECSPWSSCTYVPNGTLEIDFYDRWHDGLEKRTCTWTTNCPDEMEPEMTNVCDYKPTCFDSMLNCHEIDDYELFCEEGIDCGGPCDYKCPTCNDYIQNQGEDGIDCGGPCPNICPTCSDGLINCHLLANKTLLCEENIDCGGPCPVCPTCDDNLKNCHYVDGELICEEGIDCGGPCSELCPTEEEKKVRQMISITTISLISLAILTSIFAGQKAYGGILAYIQNRYMAMVKSMILKRRMAFQKKYVQYFDTQVQRLLPEFDSVTAKETKKQGDMLINDNTSNYTIDRYSVSFDNDYADVLTDNSIRTINYAVDLGETDAGREVLNMLIKEGIKPNYKLCKRSTTQVLEDGMDKLDNVKYDKVNGKTVARSVEFVLSFIPKNNDESEKILNVLDKYAPEKKGRGFTHVKDVRITGDEPISNFEKHTLNVKSVAGQKLIVMTKDRVLPGFKASNIWLNHGLSEFIK